MDSEPVVYQTVEKKKLYQSVVDQITQRILQNDLRPGEKLPPERELAMQFGVSRNAVREAIKALEQRGLIEVRQGAGSFVSSPSSETVSDSLALYFQTNMTRYLQLMDLREILDVEIAGRLAQDITDSDLQELKTRIAGMRTLLDRPSDYAAADVAFHLDLYKATRNEILLLIMQPVLDLLEEAMAVSFQESGSAESSLMLHERLVDRLEARDVTGARATTLELISRGKKRMKREL